MMIRAPRPEHTAATGVTTQHFAEALDLYRTLPALAGLKLSAGTGIEHGVEGTDLEPIFRNLSAVLSTSAYSQMARCPTGGTLGESTGTHTRTPVASLPFSLSCALSYRSRFNFLRGSEANVHISTACVLVLLDSNLNRP